MTKAGGWLSVLTTASTRRRALVTILAATLALLPGIGGLSYESSLLLAPLMALCAAMIVIDQIAGLRGDLKTTGKSNSESIRKRSLRELSILHAIAVAILSIGTLRIGNLHGLSQGLIFYLLGPFSSSILGCIAGLWGAALSKRRWLQVGAALCPFAFCLLLGAWRLYRDPVVFVFDPFLGHFQGPIYDENISVSASYLWYRLYNLAAALTAAIAWSILVDPKTLRLEWRKPMLRRLPRDKSKHAVLALTLGSISLWVGSRPEQYGFHATADSICETLRATRITPHFVIHYEATAKMADTIDTTAIEHEFAWQRLETMLGQAPETPVHSFIFSSPKQKRQIMGAGDVEVAAPWRRHIYLDHRPFPDGALHHELAHVFGAPFGDPVFGVSLKFPHLNMGLVEGFAMSCEVSVRDGLDLHERSAVLQFLEQVPSLRTIMGPGFWTSAPATAYTAAGSFCAWIKETQGIAVLKDLYRTAGDFEACCGTSLEELEQAWHSSLRTVDVTRHDVEVWRQVFETGSIFQRKFAHQVAALQAVIQREAPKGHHREVLDAYQSLISLEPDYATHRIAYAQALGRANRFGEAKAELSALARREGQSPRLRSRIDELQGDLFMHQALFGQAIESFEAAMQRPAPKWKQRILQLKHHAASSPELAPRIDTYLGTFDTPLEPDYAKLRRLTHALVITSLPGHLALGEYLTGIQSLAGGQAELAAQSLARSLAPHQDASKLPHPDFRQNARLALVNALCQIGAYTHARAVLARLRQQGALRRGTSQIYDLWSDRIDFFESYTRKD